MHQTWPSNTIGVHAKRHFSIYAYILDKIEKILFTQEWALEISSIEHGGLGTFRV